MGIRTRNIPVCSIVPQPTMLPRAPDRDQWRTFVNKVMNHRVSQNDGKFLVNWATGGLSRRTQVHGVSQLLIILYVSLFLNFDWSQKSRGEGKCLGYSSRPFAGYHAVKSPGYFNNSVWRLAALSKCVDKPLGITVSVKLWVTPISIEDHRSPYWRQQQTNLGVCLSVCRSSRTAKRTFIKFDTEEFYSDKVKGKAITVKGREGP
jgi:hypothetical protein